MVQFVLGEKVVAEVPEVIPSFTAHTTGSAKQSSAFTSVKPPTVWTTEVELTVTGFTP